MPLGSPLQVEDVSAELRDKARRLRQEMQLYDQNDTADGKSQPPWLLLAIAMLDAVRDEWNAQWRDSPLAMRRAMYERAVALAKVEHDRIPGDNTHELIISLPRGAVPVVAAVTARHWDPAQEKLKTHEHALQYNIVGARPLWSAYLNEAQYQLEAEGILPGDSNATVAG